MFRYIRTISLLVIAPLLAGCAIDTRGVGTSSNAAIPAARSALPVDESRFVTLVGNVYPLARPEFDQDVANSETRLNRMLLVLNPSPQKQAALEGLLDAQQDPRSPFFHQWLTPEEFGTQFGADDAALEEVLAWLTMHGFTIDEVPVGRRLVVFSGTAGQVFDTFHTEMHLYRVHDIMHLANAEDPQIPEALSNLVGGVVSLHDFRRRSQIRMRTGLGAQPAYTAGSTHYIFPADFATIYDLNPVYGAGNAGSGVSIAIAARSNIRLSDVASFRSIAGLGPNSPTVVLVGTDPGLVAKDQDESTLDVEWSGAVAPAATVKLVVGASTATTDGVDLAAAYIVNHAAALLVSLSYGSCEREMGAAEIAFYGELWEQAASEGMSVFAASGDAGAAGCSSASDVMGSGAAVSGLCSSPYSTCVGGTEFNEGSNSAQYWSAANSTSYGSALGYIPEKVWNESTFTGGSGLWASGGGASGVYAQPAWQADLSGASASSGMRAVPDVALSAADHDGYFVVENGSYLIVSGTSAASPSFAGLMALVIDGQHGAAQGNANARLYSFAKLARSPFHATPSGNNSVPGAEGFTASGADYNLATGLGSVDGTLLVNGWAATLETMPKVCSRYGLLPRLCLPVRRPPIWWSKGSELRTQ